MTKKNRLHNLPQSITEHAIGDYLAEKDNLALALTSKTTHGIFQPNRLQILANTLLLQVIRGEQDKAEKILKCYPELLEKIGKATDYYGRTFNTTAFKYSLWAHDWNMTQMMRIYLPASLQLSQLDELEDERKGITIDYKGSIQEHQHYFDLSAYMAVLDEYVNNYAIWDYEQCKTFSYNDIQTRQRELPINILQSVYFNPECKRWSFQIPNFHETKLERSNIFYNATNEKDQAWDSLSHEVSNRMVIYLSYNMNERAFTVVGVSCAAVGRGADWRAGSPIYAGGRDLQLITAFNNENIVAIKKFRQELEDLNQKSNANFIR